VAAPVEETEVDDDEVFDVPTATSGGKQNVLSAVTLDTEGDEAEPIAVPKKVVVTAKKVVTIKKKA
jgi:hypothetical protein